MTPGRPPPEGPPPEGITTEDVRRRRDFHRRLHRWFETEGRHDLPWQRDRRAYAVWVSEIMLQQTTVESVRRYYRPFLARFPTVRALAEADSDVVLALWSGLGYYRRAHNLHRAARLVVERHGGRVPRRLEDLLALPGVGLSTAGAIVSLAYDRPAVVLDTNVRRVLARFWADLHRRRGENERGLEEIARWLLPAHGGRAHTQALMDLGALVCRARDPDCPACPLRTACPGPPRESDRSSGRASSPRRTKVLTLLLRRDRRGRLLLVRRPPEGIWAGLWCLPEVDPRFFLRDGKSHRLFTRRLHRLTHLDLDIRVVDIPGGEGKGSGETPRSWKSLEDLGRLGFPPVIRGMLESLFPA
ncbi:MAG: A/G-specific adenine glycosylase [Gammaproteobacteria bacterium]|nr:A/G-specific adenine glycosylase [Gammaproteobacteria bacterium]